MKIIYLITIYCSFLFSQDHIDALIQDVLNGSRDSVAISLPLIEEEYPINLVKLIDSGQFEIAFSLYHTSIQQLLSVADANEVMPPKSTWFEPKLRSGMVVNLLND